jgi:hypothetical protein
MIHYEDEFVFRGWTHGIGHVSGDIRTLKSHDTTVPLVTTHISWFPRDDDFNKHSQKQGLEQSPYLTEIQLDLHPEETRRSYSIGDMVRQREH